MNGDPNIPPYGCCTDPTGISSQNMAPSSTKPGVPSLLGVSARLGRRVQVQLQAGQKQVVRLGDGCAKGQKCGYVKIEIILLHFLQT